MNARMTVTMNARAKKLLDEALTLPEDERAKLAHDLLDSLDGAPDEDVEEAWRVEIERRVKGVEEGRGVSYPIEESLARIREKLHPR